MSESESECCTNCGCETDKEPSVLCDECMEFGVMPLDEYMELNAMSLNEYQRQAERTADVGNGFNADEDHKNRMNGSLLGLAGEAGEVIDVMKKVLHHGHALDKEKVTKELGDVLWYVSDIASALGILLSDVAEANIEKLKKRYPNGFNKNASINRDSE